MGIELLGKGKKRRVEFACPECGSRNVKWVDKQPETKAAKLIKRVVFHCSFCEAMLTIEPEEEL